MKSIEALAHWHAGELVANIYRLKAIISGGRRQVLGTSVCPCLRVLLTQFLFHFPLTPSR